MVLVRDALDLQLLGRARESTIGSARRRKGRSFIEIEVLSVPLLRHFITLINDQRYAGLDLYHRIFFSFEVRKSSSFQMAALSTVASSAARRGRLSIPHAVFFACDVQVKT